VRAKSGDVHWIVTLAPAASRYRSRW
jgi:hypothetical protein